jgi:DNA-binding cell septation regulator SpoVG
MSTNAIAKVTTKLLATDQSGRFKAVVRVNFNNPQIRSMDVKVMDGKDGLFVALPGQRSRTDSSRFFPDVKFSDTTMEELNKKALGSFKLALRNAQTREKVSTGA